MPVKVILKQEYEGLPIDAEMLVSTEKHKRMIKDKIKFNSKIKSNTREVTFDEIEKEIKKQ